jgi:hypothetical protein
LDNRFIRVFWHKENSEETLEEKKTTPKKTFAPPPPQPITPVFQKPVFIPLPGFISGMEAQKERKVQTIMASAQHTLDLQLKNYKEMVSNLEKMKDSDEKKELTIKVKQLFENLQIAMDSQQKNVEETKIKKEEEKRKREENKEGEVENSEESLAKKPKIEESTTLETVVTPEVVVTTSSPSFRGGFRGRGGFIGTRGGSWPSRGGAIGITRPSFNLDNRTSTFEVKNIPKELKNENAIRQHFQVKFF